MKFFILLIITGFTLPAYSQQTLWLSNGGTIDAGPYWQTKDSVYMLMQGTVYKIAKTELKTVPDKLLTVDQKSTEYYLMQFRRTELTGIWIAILGGTIAGIGAAAGSKAAAYTGLGIGVIGFGITLGGYSNLKKAYVFGEAKPYPN
jgi:hypothetical protein